MKAKASPSRTKHVTDADAIGALLRRRFKRGSKRYIAWYATLSVLLVAVLILATIYYATLPVTLRVAVNTENDQDSKALQQLATLLKNERSRLRLILVPTSDSADTKAKLTTGQVELAVTRADADLPENARGVVVLRKNALLMWDVRRNASSQNLADLVGRRIAIVGSAPSDKSFIEFVLKHSGVDRTSLNLHHSEQLAAALRSRQVEAVAVVAPLGSPLISATIATSAEHAGEPQFLSIDAADAIALRSPQYETIEIPQGALGATPQRPPEKLDTLTVNDLLVARKEVSDVTIADLTRLLLAQSAWARKDGGPRLEVINTAKDAALPAHEGAAAFIDGTERTFIERYSDIFWFGLVLISGLGSAGLGLRSFLKLDERRANLRLRKHLVSITSQLASIDSTDELKRLCDEADVILDHTLRCHEDGAIDDGSLAAFGLLLMQFHAKASNRKAALRTKS